MASRGKTVSYKDNIVRPVTLTSLDDSSNQPSVTASNNVGGSTEDRVAAILAEAASPRSQTSSRGGADTGSGVISPHNSETSSAMPNLNDTNQSQEV